MGELSASTQNQKYYIALNKSLEPKFRGRGPGPHLLPLNSLIYPSQIRPVNIPSRTVAAQIRVSCVYRVHEILLCGYVFYCFEDRIKVKTFLQLEMESIIIFELIILV